jgi:hypothetical protein
MTSAEKAKCELSKSEMMDNVFIIYLLNYLK